MLVVLRLSEFRMNTFSSQEKLSHEEGRGGMRRRLTVPISCNVTSCLVGLRVSIIITFSVILRLCRCYSTDIRRRHHRKHKKTRVTSNSSHAPAGFGPSIWETPPTTCIPTSLAPFAHALRRIRTEL